MLGRSMKLSVLSNALSQDTTVFYFPAGIWCNMWQNLGDQACFTSVGQNMTMPSKAYNFYVHLRENSIVPMQNVTFLQELYAEKSFRSTTDMQDQAVELHILPNAEGKAIGKLWNDDGETNTINSADIDDVIATDYYFSYAENADKSLQMDVTCGHCNFGVINSNDVLGQIHIYNAKARGLNANQYW